MDPFRCAYCGTPVENPVRLSWVLPDRKAAGGRLGIRIPLCVDCSNSWCPPAGAPADGAQGPGDGLQAA